jgi:ribonuclease-3
LTTLIPNAISTSCPTWPGAHPSGRLCPTPSDSAAITLPSSCERSTLKQEDCIEVAARAQRRLGLTFQDQSLLEQAFVHRSFLNENPDFHLGSNERLEYLGDAVVNLVVANHLFRTYSTAAEGDLTAMRAELVRFQTLGRLAANLKLGDLLYLSKGEADDGARLRPRILAQTFEALIGAIYVDRGPDQAAAFVLNQLAADLTGLADRKSFRDAKSRLQESIQAATGTAPNYFVESAEGPGHRPRFVVTVRLGRDVLATGEGDSKQEAEQEAAALALETWPPVKV